jgi:hypothetical protein
MRSRTSPLFWREWNTRWLILHRRVRYEERGPAVTKQSKQKAQCENDPSTPKPRLSDRSAESSTQPSLQAHGTRLPPIMAPATALLSSWRLPFPSRGRNHAGQSDTRKARCGLPLAEKDRHRDLRSSVQGDDVPPTCCVYACAAGIARRTSCVAPFHGWSATRPISTPRNSVY